MTVLGIDASLTSTGLCLINDAFFNCNKIKTTTLINRLDGIERILFIEKNIEKWAKQADIIVIENYAYEQKYRRESLAELQGVIKRRLYLMKKPLFVISTQKVKKVLTGRGNKPKGIKLSVKEWTLKETKKRYYLDFGKKDDECDAFGLALIGLLIGMYQNNITIPKQYDFQKKIALDVLYPPKKIKKDLNYYMKFPYKIIGYENNGKYYITCPGINYTWKGETLEEAYKNYKDGKKNQIKNLRKNKVRMKTAKKYLGGVSYIKKMK